MLCIFITYNRAMSFFAEFKPEIKLLVIVSVVAVMIAVGGILLLQGVVRNQVSHTPADQQSQQQTIDNQQPSIDTSDWQTYRNAEYGFEVKYPEDWSVVDNQIMPASYTERCEKFKEEGGHDNCMILAVGGAVGETFEFFGIGSGMQHMQATGDLPQEKLGNNEFLILNNTFEGIGEKNYFIQKSGENEYIRLYHGQRYDQKRDENTKVIDQILATFRFVDEGQEVSLYSTISDFVCNLREGEKDITDLTNSSVVESRQRILALGVSGSYFDSHFKLTCGKVLRNGRTQVTWRYNIGEYTTGIGDTFPTFPSLSLENTVGQLHEIQHVLTQKEALSIMKSCVGEFINPVIVHGLISDIPTSNQAGLYVTANPTRESRSGFHEVAFVNVETGVCRVVERENPPPLPGG